MDESAQVLPMGSRTMTRRATHCVRKVSFRATGGKQPAQRQECVEFGIEQLTLYLQGTCGAEIALDVSTASFSSSSCFSEPFFSSREERDDVEGVREA